MGTRGARALSRFAAGIFGEGGSKVDRPSAAVYRPAMGDARTRFTAIVAPSVTRIPLAEAALWIAAEEYPDLDVEAYIDRLDEMAESVRPRLAAADAPSTIARFNEFVFAELGFGPNEAEYHDPRNSFLNDVIDRRVGIPITLSLVYIELCARLALPVVGVGFPGHFLVKWVGPSEVLIDPFFRKVISRGECLERLKASYGPQARLDEEMLAPATPRQIVLRMLRNLKHNYLGRGDLPRALAAIDRALLVSPEEAAELRDRGILYSRLECFAAALRDLERYLELAPDDPLAAEIRGRLPDLRREAARLQ
jgi:regulator of sirC expression with transglutaminase-like and TPR domain